MNKERPHISVCICTFQRVELLKRLLQDLDRQETNGLFTFSIVVAENDDSQSARIVVTNFAAASRISVTYCVQPVRSIALTHNTAVENASGDFIAFIDDDEFPTPNWLCRLFEACLKSGVDGVLGPVKPYFEETAPDWIVKGGLFDRPSHPTGMHLKWFHTRAGNVLMKKDMWMQEGGRFDPQLRAGSDRDFFKRMIERDRTFIWCEEALVFEVVPPARWKRSFLIRRAVFRGVFSLHTQHGVRAIVVSLVAIPAYLVALPIALILGQGKFMKYVYSLSYHVGRLLAFVGIDPIKDPYVTG